MDKSPSRQGDIFFIPVERIPEGAELVARENGEIIIAYGEATGHAHAIADDGVEMLSLPDEVDRWLRVRSTSFNQVMVRDGQPVFVCGARVLHPDHDQNGTSTIRPDVVLPAGNYLVRRQVQYSPEAIRQVAD